VENGIKAIYNFLIWWKHDQFEVSKEASQYNSLPFKKSSRKIAASLLMLSFAVNLLMGGEGAWVDASIFGLLAVFVFAGHRWAIVTAMIFWTFSKGYAIYEKPQSSVLHVFWWCFYMQALYLAFLVEVRRRELAKINISNETNTQNPKT